MNISKVHFSHRCFAGATVAGITTIAGIVGHTNGGVIIHVCVVVVAMLALTSIYANFK